MNTILISTSKFDNPVSNYYYNLGLLFVRDGFRVVYIFDKQFRDYPDGPENIGYYTWVNRRPTKLKDFILAYKIIKKEQPVLCISNFGSTNIVSIISFLLGVKNRINYIHTTSKALQADSNRSNLSTRLLRSRKKIVYALNTHFFTNSVGSKEDVTGIFGLPKRKISVFPFLIPHSNLSYKPFGTRKKHVCIVGRLHPVKGHRRLLHSFKNCVLKWPDLQLVVVGDGYLKSDLVTLCNTLGLSNNIMFKGSIPNREINDVFSNSLINISASIDEAYGLVSIEALREGTPIISSRTTGSLDILEDGFNGLFVDFEIPLSLMTAIEQILENWEDFSRNALKTFNEKYSMDNLKHHYKEIRMFT